MACYLDGIARSPRLRLCTWNLHLGIDLPDILESLGSAPDFDGVEVLALQEASVHDGVEDAAVIATRLGPTYRHLQVPAHTLHGHIQANGLVWDARRVEVRESSELRLPKRAENPLSRTERTLLSVTPLQPRMSLAFDCRVDGLAWLLYVTHLDVFGYRHKLEQFGAILADLEQRPAADVTVIAGDLNTFRLVGRRPRWKRLQEAAEVAGFEDLTGDIRWTHSFRRVPHRQKLDAIFIRSQRSLLYESWSLDLPGSDHIPVFADIRGWG